MLTVAEKPVTQGGAVSAEDFVDKLQADCL